MFAWICVDGLQMVDSATTQRREAAQLLFGPWRVDACDASRLSGGARDQLWVAAQSWWLPCRFLCASICKAIQFLQKQRSKSSIKRICCQLLSANYVVCYMDWLAIWFATEICNGFPVIFSSNSWLLTLILEQGWPPEDHWTSFGAQNPKSWTCWTTVMVDLFGQDSQCWGVFGPKSFGRGQVHVMHKDDAWEFSSYTSCLPSLPEGPKCSGSFAEAKLQW